MTKWRRHMTWLALLIAVGTTIVPLRGTAEAVLVRHYDPWDSPRIGDPDDGGTSALDVKDHGPSAYWSPAIFYGLLAQWSYWLLAYDVEPKADFIIHDGD